MSGTDLCVGGVQGKAASLAPEEPLALRQRGSGPSSALGPMPLFPCLDSQAQIKLSTSKYHQQNFHRQRSASASGAEHFPCWLTAANC